MVLSFYNYNEIGNTWEYPGLKIHYLPMEIINESHRVIMEKQDVDV